MGGGGGCVVVMELEVAVESWVCVFRICGVGFRYDIINDICPCTSAIPLLSLLIIYFRPTVKFS